MLKEIAELEASLEAADGKCAAPLLAAYLSQATDPQAFVARLAGLLKDRPQAAPIVADWICSHADLPDPTWLCQNLCVAVLNCAIERFNAGEREAVLRALEAAEGLGLENVGLTGRVVRLFAACERFDKAVLYWQQAPQSVPADDMRGCYAEAIAAAVRSDAFPRAFDLIANLKTLVGDDGFAAMLTRETALSAYKASIEKARAGELERAAELLPAIESALPDEAAIRTFREMLARAWFQKSVHWLNEARPLQSAEAYLTGLGFGPLDDPGLDTLRAGLTSRLADQLARAIAADDCTAAVTAFGMIRVISADFRFGTAIIANLSAKLGRELRQLPRALDLVRAERMLSLWPAVQALALDTTRFEAVWTWLAKAATGEEPCDSRPTRLLESAAAHGQPPAGLCIALADVCRHQGKAQQAAVLYRAALEMEPDNLVATDGLVWSLIKLDRLDDGYETALRAATLPGGDIRLATFLAGMGGQFLSAEQPERSIIFWRKALSLFPDWPDLRRQAAWLEHRLGNLAAAAEHAEFAARTRTDDSALFAKLGDIYRGLNRIEEAVRAYEHCISLRPDHRLAKMYLMNLQQRY